LKFCYPRLGGLVLGYENLKAHPNFGPIMGYIHIVIRASFYIFAPKVGTTIEGREILKN